MVIRLSLPRAATSTIVRQHSSLQRSGFESAGWLSLNAPGRIKPNCPSNEIRPFLRAVQLGYVPGENPTRLRRAEFRFNVRKARCLIASFAYLADAVQHPIHRRHRAGVGFLRPREWHGCTARCDRRSAADERHPRALAFQPRSRPAMTGGEPGVSHLFACGLARLVSPLLPRQR